MKEYSFQPRLAEFRANPYPAYKYLREHQPVLYRPGHNDWLVTSYEDVLAVLKNPSFGRKEHTDISVQDELLKYRWESKKMMSLWLLLRNPPDHTRLRRFLHRSFNFQSKKMTSWIQSKVESMVSQYQNNDQIDIIHDFAYPLTESVICHILGISDKERDIKFKQWAHGMMKLMDIDATPVAQEQGLLCMAGFTNYFCRLVKDRENRTNDGYLTCALIEGKKQGILSPEEVLAHLTALYIGGHITTMHLISNGIWLLLRHPDQLSLLKEDSSKIPNAIQEMVRYYPPFSLLSRTALKDTEISGTIIPKDQTVHLILDSANRDSRHYKEPDNFDISRSNTNLSFGHGIHYCFGAQLAQTVSQIAIHTLIHRFPNMSLPNNFVIEWEETFMTRGLKNLPVDF